MNVLLGFFVIVVIVVVIVVTLRFLAKTGILPWLAVIFFVAVGLSLSWAVILEIDWGITANDGGHFALGVFLAFLALGSFCIALVIAGMLIEDQGFGRGIVLVLAVISIGVLIWEISPVVAGHIQSNALPVHDSLMNMQIQQNGYSVGIYSDNAGLHITDNNYYYSDTNYGDGDVSVTVKLTGYTDSNSMALTAYGLKTRYNTNTYNPYNLEITSDGRWFNNEYAINYTVPTNSGTPNSAIRTGVGATNTLEVRMHGTHAAFFVNGVKVDEEDFPGSQTLGTIAFTARTLQGDPANSISVIFTDLTINRS